MGGGHLSRPDFGMPQPDPAHPLTGPYRECLIEQDAEDEKARRSQEDSL